MKHFSILFYLSLFIPVSLHAQNEVEIERNSLTGIDQFGVVVNIEKPGGLEVENLKADLIRQEILESIQDIQATILGLETLKKSYDYPFLHVHVNIMRAANNTYPYAIELRFYQPVKLSLRRNTEIMAATWHAGSVGIVSSDLLLSIAPAVVTAVDEFREAFLLVN